MNHCDLIVIGGGVLGTFHAYHALKKGLKVALLEKNEHPRGATVRNFGQIVPSGMNKKWQLLGRRSTEIYKSIQHEFDISVRQEGSVYIASDKEELNLIEELAIINEDNNYHSQFLNSSESLNRYEGLKKSYCKGALFFPEEISLNPRVAVSRILKYLEEQYELSYHPNTLTIDIELSGNHCIVNNNNKQQLKAEKVIVCSGSEFKMLFPKIFAESPIEISKIQMLQTKAQPTQKLHGNILTGLTVRRYEAFQECPSWQAVKAREPKDDFVKQYGIHILFKQAVDGSIILGDSHEYAKQSDELSFDIDENINQFIIKEAQRIFELQNWGIQQTWYGIYSQNRTSDIFEHTIDDKIHIVTGIGGKGMTGSAGFAEQSINQLFS